MLHTEVVVEGSCYSCGHHNTTSTACEFEHNKYLVSIGKLKQDEFDKKGKAHTG